MPPTVIDLSTFTASQGFIVQGDATNDRAGHSVSNAGDINGDGFDDFIVGAPRGDNGGYNAGEAYVIFGKAGATRANIDLAALSPSDGFIIQGDADTDLAGSSVSSAGDVNGDGIDDLIVGAPNGDNGGSFAGEAYVIFGQTGLRPNIDLTILAASDGFVIQDNMFLDSAGFSVSSAGDINGDGIDDLIIGAPGGDNGGNSAGEAYVIFGRVGPTRVNIDLSTLAANDGFVIVGDMAGDEAGQSVSSAGDVNGDGIDDLIVGAPNGGNGGDFAGEAYVIFGRAGATRANIDLSSLSATDGFIIQGDAAGDAAGRSVSNAGDINGDGIDDLIVGAPGGDNGGLGAGEAYVIFGRAGATRANIDLTNLAASDGCVIRGDAADDRAGSDVSSAGDVNGDGIDDLIVGAPNGGNGGDFAGEAYVIFGRPGATRANIDLTTMTERDGFIVQGDLVGDYAGRSVSAAGDINGDGFGDLIVGAPNGDNGGSEAGEAYVIFGSTAYAPPGGQFDGTAAGDILNGTTLADQLNGLGGDDVLWGGAGDDTLDGGTGGDIMYGELGNDIYIVDSISDSVIDAGGTDTIRTSVSLVLPTAVENLTLTASGLSGFGNNGNNILTGTASNDILDGQGGNDTINAGIAGNDTLSGGAGNDVFVMGGSLRATDQINGGADSDQVGMSGSFVGVNALVFNATTLTNVEVLALLPGTGHGYHITTHDATVAAGVEMTIFAGNLGAGQNFTFNGGAETNGFFRTFGGLGTDTITGGGLSDGFYFGPGKWQAGDNVTGGGGTNDQLALDGDYTLTIGASADVEVLVLLASPDAGNPNDFNITLAAAWAAAGQIRTVFARNVTTAAVINGAATNARLTIFGGRGSDTLTSGSDFDTIYGLEGDDLITGGAALDTAVYQGRRASYSVVTGGGNVQIVDNDAVTDGDDGTDTVVGIEFAQFADQTISITSPIILDLDGGGVETLSASQSNAAFDMDGDGIGDDTSWFGRGEGLLFLDRDGNGTLSNAGEMSFTNDVANARSDLEGLAAWDSNGDGVLSKQDKRFTSFKIWRDRDGDGVVDRREVMTLRQAGVRSLSLSGTANNGTYALGDTAIVNTGSFTRTNGRRGGFVDAVLTGVSSKADTETAAQRALVTAGGDPLDAMRDSLAARTEVTSDSFDPRVTVMTQDMASFGGSAHAIATDMDRWRQQGTASMDVFAA